MARSNQNIFIVDDEPVIAETLVEILKFHGYNAIGFDQPASALAATSESCPTVLISDFMMADLNGIELAYRVLQSCPDCGVIFMTASLNTAPLKECGLASSVLSKPVTVTNLLVAVTKAVSAL